MKNRSNIFGFTLLEVMISVAILGVIMTLIWSTTGQTFRAKERTEARDMVFHEGNVALRKISDDITSAFLAKTKSTTAFPTEAQTSTQADQAFKTFFTGEDNGGQDSVKFSTLSHVRLFKNAKESDQSKVLYEVVESKDEDRTLKLMRREDPRLNADTEVKGRQLELISNIREFNLEYFDMRRNEWVKSWDSEKVDWKDRIPSAVRITLVFPDPADDKEEIIISTTAMTAMNSVIEM